MRHPSFTVVDLCCKAGGMSAGLARAGFRVIGVDREPQPRYPFEFIQADALTVDLDELGADAYAVSPPCQPFSVTRHIPNSRAADYDDIVAPMRARLAATGRPYVIENVPEAPLRADLMLCGSMFGLVLDDYELRRHRVFELEGFTCPQLACRHGRKVLGVYGKGGPNATGKGRVATISEARALMGAPWMVTREICQAVPPAYAEFIGRHLHRALQGARAAA